MLQQFYKSVVNYKVLIAKKNVTVIKMIILNVGVSGFRKMNRVIKDCEVFLNTRIDIIVYKKLKFILSTISYPNETKSR